MNPDQDQFNPSPSTQPAQVTPPVNPAPAIPQQPPYNPNPITTPPSGMPPQQPAQYGSSGGGSKKKMIIAIVIVVVLVLGGVVAAMSMSKKDDSTTPTDLSQYKDDNSSGGDSGDQTTNPKKEAIKTPLNASVKTDLGYTIQATELVRDYPAKYPDQGKETVLVKVTITYVDPKYTGSSPYNTDFSLLSGGKEVGDISVASDNEISTAGYTALPTESAQKDKPVSGYLSFDVPTGTKTLTLRYTQKETKILGGGSIPSKNYDLAL